MKKHETNIETITLEQKLSVEELEISSQKLANLVHNLTDLKAEKASVNKSFNERIKSIETIMEITAQEVETSIRKTQLDVTRRANTKTNEWELVDLETGEVVKREPYLLAPAPLFDEPKDDVTEAVEVDEEELEEA